MVLAWSANVTHHSSDGPVHAEFDHGAIMLFMKPLTIPQTEQPSCPSVMLPCSVHCCLQTLVMF